MIKYKIHRKPSVNTCNEIQIYTYDILEEKLFTQLYSINKIKHKTHKKHQIKYEEVNRNNIN